MFRLVRIGAAALCGWLGLMAATAAVAEHLDQTTYETRTVLYFKVPDDALAKLLPAGWEPTMFTSGPATGANLVVNISDQLFASGVANATPGDLRSRGVTISARVRDPQNGEPRAMVMFGFTTGTDAPGPYGAHRPATIAMSRSTSSDAAGTLVEEVWDAATTTGDGLKLDLTYTRGAMSASHVDQQTRSSVHPTFYRIYKMDLISDVVQSEADHVDHLRRLEFSATGEAGKLLDGAQKPIAIVSVPIYRREIWLPD